MHLERLLQHTEILCTLSMELNRTLLLSVYKNRIAMQVGQQVACAVGKPKNSRCFRHMPKQFGKERNTCHPKRRRHWQGGLCRPFGVALGALSTRREEVSAKQCKGVRMVEGGCGAFHIAVQRRLKTLSVWHLPAIA